ncbi:hypothetical protein [Owenweeksia hongkongensis]|uniref:hypothetical protein n=1 Tax=Owenweeksia hongkongensis TaxID=253245 RepID=UPI003A947C3B
MKKLLKFSSKNLTMIALVCLTLGLAPFAPEPHVWEKLKWVANGAVGMVWYDWFDLLLHGSPWAMLIIGLVGRFALSKDETASIG